jgi:2-dehydropantoate 2-reductase
MQDKTMRILIVGAGSTGGYFGGRLMQAGQDVTFLVRAHRAAVLREQGLQIVSPLGNAKLAPQMVSASALRGAFDLVLVTVKSFALAAAMDDMAPAVGEHTMVLPVLNGMAHMPALAARFGEATLIGGLCKIVGTLDDAGRVVQMSPMHELTYGERDGSRSPRIEALDARMQTATFDARLSIRIVEEMWEKWLMLATLGAITCLMRGNIGDIAAVAGGKQFQSDLLDEAVAIVTAASHAPADGFVDALRRQMTQEHSSFTASMFRDLRQGLPVEARQIVGDLLAHAYRLGVATPLLGAAYVALAVYQGQIGQVEDALS